jgi:2-dehydro-3-deoxyphosphogluconate aldolase / (4S)-4-hydroxy-2-oxoglutarate aldolase
VTLDVIRAQGIVAIVRAASADAAAGAVDTLVAAGLRAVEVSLVTPDALEVVRAAAAHAPDGVAIGVGTVLRPSEVEASLLAGARFLVSPSFDPRVVAAAVDAGLDILPGVATPTEAVNAINAGAQAVKLFPASLWSPGVLREVRAALPRLQTVPTGGITPESAPDWIRAGAVAVGMGSALTKAPDPAEAARRLIASIDAAR